MLNSSSQKEERSTQLPDYDYLPKLHNLKLGSGLSFYIFEKQPLVKLSNFCVVFLPGLGEARSGLNYLFSSLSHKFANKGCLTIQVDLAGCGESTLPLERKMWIAQLEAIKQHLNKKEIFNVHFVTKGLSSILNEHNQNGLNFSICPFDPDLFKSWLPKINVVSHPTLWLPQNPECLCLEEEIFWYRLGIEAGCVGGLSISKDFLSEISNFNFVPSKETISIFSKCDPFHYQSEQSIILENSHPFFLLDSDKDALFNEINTKIIGNYGKEL
ncbi:MAG: hypothetical protein S4CHLAM6_09630 [Chlamydiae bacterium]|nr:hypothetical protein [Chlamydiota bacterium]